MIWIYNKLMMKLIISQFELANGNSSTAGGAATATSMGGNFGLKMLINDLHQHSKIKGQFN